jgi:hypothetical protein
MRHTVRTLLVPALAAAALVGAGCGSDDDFVEDYNNATAPLARLASAGATGTGQDGAPNQNLARMADGLEQVEERLRALDAPADARKEYDRLIAAVDAGGAQVRRMAEAVEAGDMDRFADEARTFSARGAELVQAEQTLRAAVEG